MKGAGGQEAWSGVSGGCRRQKQTTLVERKEMGQQRGISESFAFLFLR